MAENEDKQLEDEDGPPPEAILETEQQRDPDEAVFAEQAIHHYADQVLDQFRQSVETALERVHGLGPIAERRRSIQQCGVQHADRRRLFARR